MLGPVRRRRAVQSRLRSADVRGVTRRRELRSNDRPDAGLVERPQRLTPLTYARQCERVAGKGRASGPYRVEGVVFAAQPPLGLRHTAGLEHRLATADEVAGKAGTVTAGALDRPHASATPGFERKRQCRGVAAPARAHRPLRDNRARWQSNDGKDVFVQVRVDADDVVQLICKHPDRSSELVRRVRWYRSDCMETAAAGL